MRRRPPGPLGGQSDPCISCPWTWPRWRIGLPGANSQSPSEGLSPEPIRKDRAAALAWRLNQGTAGGWALRRCDAGLGAVVACGPRLLHLGAAECSEEGALEVAAGARGVVATGSNRVADAYAAVRRVLVVVLLIGYGLGQRLAQPHHQF